MAPTKKSIYRQPGAQHFQLVHRSVRDPLINDPEASQQVFKPVERYNDAGKSGVTLAELDATLDKTKMRANEGEAAQYGITFDDSSYDYMAHLRPVGEAGFESVLLEAPRGSAATHGMKRQPDALASRDEISWQQAQDAYEAIPAELQGFQPDMDPHLRQVLEALDDDEFVDDDGDGSLFDDLLGGGELEDGDEAPEFEFAEWGVDENDEDDDDSKTEAGEETWEDRFRAFKAAGGRHPEQKATSNGGWDDDEADPAERSEMADTIGSLVSGFGDMVVRGGKKRHGKRGPSDASGMSMSSASVYRNAGLRSLDDRFDVIEREYELDDEDDEYLDMDDDDVSIAPSFMSSMSRASMASKAAEDHGPVELSREDFDSIMDDFLDNYEVVGSRMRESLGGTALTGAEKLSVLRAALEQGEEGDGIGREENRRRILELEQLNRGYVKEKKEKVALRDIDEKAEPKWDVETILSTYTNTENHPGTIRIRSSEEQKARLLRRAEEAEKAAARAAAKALPVTEEDDDSGSETEREAPKVTVSRPKGESAEERKARKAAVKEQRANRRQEKKKHTETFGAERKRQIASHQKMVGGGRAADVAVGSRGVVSLK
ncbi:hypothetical protein VHUM_04133 [Vanrija humicola]|uniref:Uncharacterized protein n=1 Tax=Vanrija humicola TaxID=5417 RepID=A0A7D8YSW6_VANHU|nr:hypothetical protein VHUM_04133 [Vanrija humicola]